MTVAESLDVEKRALGCLLLAPALIARAEIGPEQFWLPEHRRIVSALLEMPEAVPAGDVLERLAEEGMSPKDWLAAVQEIHDLSRASFYRILEKLVATKQVQKSEAGLYVRANR